MAEANEKATTTTPSESSTTASSVDLEKNEVSPLQNLSATQPPIRPTTATSVSFAPPVTSDPTPSISRPGLSTAQTSRSTRTILQPLKRSETKLAQKEAHPWQHVGITLGGPMIVLFDIVVPIIIYYTWYNSRQRSWRSACLAQDQTAGVNCSITKPADFDKDILGSAVASFGIGELWILIARVYRLIVRREECAPLLSRAWWELDATAWVYLVAMIVALIPFVVGSSLVLPRLYLYGPSFLMGFLGFLMVATLLLSLTPIKLPIGINSERRGLRMRPFIYYAAEDFIAVDGLQDREFRVRYNERYERNAMFRKFFVYLTIWWTVGVMVYIGAVSAVIWTLEFHYAFGSMLGLLFGFIAIWASTTIVWVNWEMKREHTAWEKEMDRLEEDGAFGS